MTREMGFSSWREQRFFLCHNVQTGSGVHPASCPVGTATHFLGVKQLEHDIAYHSSLSTVVDEGRWVVFTRRPRLIVGCSANVLPFLFRIKKYECVICNIVIIIPVN
jgi:hypothetical protein